MSDTLTEMQGCDLLARLFKARGYVIKRNLQFREYGVDFHIDGWDAKARVGFEFLTSEDEDHDDLSLEEYQTLTAAQQRGELALFMIDEVEPLSADELVTTANEFLDEVAAAAKARLKPRKKPAPQKRAVARKKTAGRKPVKKAAKASKRKPTTKKKTARRKR